MYKNLPIIQSLWIGGNLSNIELLSISSFLNHGHEFHLYTYGKIDNIPLGVSVMDANEILPESLIFKNKYGSYAIFADWFRWELLYRKGGFWVDTDIICIRPFVFQEDIIFGLQEGGRVGTAVLGFPKEHELTRLMADICKDPNILKSYDPFLLKCLKILRRIFKNHRKNVFWGEAGGPSGFTRVLKHYKMMDKAKPFMFFFPIHYSNYYCVFDTSLNGDQELFNNTYGLHLWNEMFRGNKDFNKNAQFHENSLIEQLKRKHLKQELYV